MSRNGASSAGWARGLLERSTSALPPAPPGSRGLVAEDEGDGAVTEVGRPVPYRPAVQLAVRSALWLALGVGAVGGSAALLGVVEGEAPAEAAPAEEPLDTTAVPSPVAGTAELAVEQWLTATDEDDGALLDELFVEEVAPAPSDDGVDVDVLGTTTVAGHLVQEGYWVVTVRAEIVEQIDGEAQPPASWWVELGIVGDPGTRLAALSTPGVLPAPPSLEDGWQSSRPSLQPPADDDSVAITVEGFLDALLTGRADPSPYLAPDAVVPTTTQPPFADVEVDQIATADEENGDLQVWVDVTVTSPGGREQPVAYELVVAPRADDWEIRFVWGAPSLGAGPTAN